MDGAKGTLKTIPQEHTEAFLNSFKGGPDREKLKELSSVHKFKKDCTNCKKCKCK